MSDMAVKIAENIQHREFALEVIEMCGERPQRFWEALSQFVDEKLPPKPVPVDPCPPMDDKEAANFERWIMPYGKYGGEVMGNIPVGYMLWLTEGDEVVKSARRYVKSKRFSERQDQETPTDYDSE